MSGKSGKPRVPRRNDLFDQYINSSTSYLLKGTSPVNWQRLSLTQAEMDKWEDDKNKWNLIYPKYTSKNIRTSTITKDKNNLKKDFTNYVRPLLTRMSGSANLIEADRLALRLRKPDRTPTARGLIEDAPVVMLISMPGGRIKVKCRIEHDSNRASMHPLADAFEMRIQIGDPVPANPNECLMSAFSTKAIFTYHSGDENAGKRIYVFCRYVNFSNPAHNGPFTTRHTVIIL